MAMTCRDQSVTYTCMPESLPNSEGADAVRSAGCMGPCESCYLGGLQKSASQRHWHRLHNVVSLISGCRRLQAFQGPRSCGSRAAADSFGRKQTLTTLPFLQGMYRRRAIDKAHSCECFHVPCQDKILKESDEFVPAAQHTVESKGVRLSALSMPGVRSTMAALLQPYCEEALGKAGATGSAL